MHSDCLTALTLQGRSERPAIPAFGYRNNNSASLNNVGSNGYRWLSVPNNSNNGHYLNFNSSNVNPQNNDNRANGYGVRPALENCTAEADWITDKTTIIATETNMTKKEIFNRLVKAYYKARRNIRTSASQLEFEMSLEYNLYQICLDLHLRKYSFSRAVLFIAHERVARQVCAPHFRDRVVSVLLSTFLLLIFEPGFIYDSYACRTGKGVLFGVKRMAHHLRQASHNFTTPVLCIKLDIEGFFLNINHNTLDSVITRKLTSRKTVTRYGNALDLGFILWLSRVFIHRDLLANCNNYTTEREEKAIPANKLLKNHPQGCGLIPGDCSGQLFANILADGQDGFIKRVLKCKHYGRYMDDSYIFLEDSGRRAEQLLSSVSHFVATNLALRVHTKKSKITSYSNRGFAFLGARAIYFRLSPCTYIYSTVRRVFRRAAPATLPPRGTLNSYRSYLSHYTYNQYKLSVIS